jgi:hypothetical protein
VPQSIVNLSPMAGRIIRAEVSLSY